MTWPLDLPGTALLAVGVVAAALLNWYVVRRATARLARACQTHNQATISATWHHVDRSFRRQRIYLMPLMLLGAALLATQLLSYVVVALPL